MKHFVPFLKSFVLVCTSFVVFTTTSSSQINEFVFTNHSRISGTAGANGTVYRFPSVTAGMDALVTIKGRSSNQVSIVTMDLTSTGFGKAFQPQIQYGTGTISGGLNWWVEFEVKFVSQNTSVPLMINDFDVTALDIDGNGGNLKEYVAFYNPNSFKVEANTILSVSNFIPVSSVAGTLFTGSSTTYNGVDTTATRVMASLNYVNTSTITFRMGGVTTGSASADPRMYSVWFRDFNYQQPSSLPVKLMNFTGNSNNNKVTLQWTVASNEDADYYEIERSANGRDFTKAAMIFPTEKAGTEIYSYKETAQANKSIYRLKLIDKNGTVTYSKVLAFQMNDMAQQSLKINGNPSGNQVCFSYKTKSNQVQVRMYDMNGRTLIQKAVATMEGTNLISIDLSAATGNGMYILEVVDGGTRTSARFIK